MPRARPKPVETAVRAEIAALGEPVAMSGLATATIAVAALLDGAPAEYAAAGLLRELRMSLAELHRRAEVDLDDELEQTLRRIAAPALRHGDAG
jgi:hypothetical protein